MNILVIEDEKKVAAFLKDGLEEQGYHVDLAYDADSGEKLVFNKEYQILLLDVIIPGMNGLLLCKKIKNAQPDIPILMLTALGTTDDKVTGFDAGADDYLVKPFEFKELLARIKALTKRSQGVANEKAKEEILKVADLQLDLGKKVAIREGKVISLTAKE